MAWSHATSVDLHRNMLGMARARYLLGDLDVAWGMAEECRDLVSLLGQPGAKVVWNQDKPWKCDDCCKP